LSSYEFLGRLLVAEFGVRRDEITPESTPASLGLDSLSMAELVGELEEEFGIAISAKQANFKTLGEASALMDALIEAGRA
jgi:acyl carrier protein